ncbi:MAG: hypothetical protein KF761_10620 [Salinibacterium sp.]|nr:hypothetical protein [Salinibacterium sp.]
MRRLLVLVLAVLGLVLVGAIPANAATKHAGMPTLTPYGGYIGNYLAPDGFRVYCIDSPLPWPSGSTSGPSSVDSLVTTWGSTLSPTELRKLNYVLLTYGQTDDPVQAAAVAAFVNAYTSGWARDLGAGYAAGAWYLSGNVQVLSVYDVIWADAEAHADPRGTATVSLEMTDSMSGTVVVHASRATATGTLSLAGAVHADTGESVVAVTADDRIPIRGTPADDAREYVISAAATFTDSVPAAANLMLYFTPGQQRTIRGATTGDIQFSASTISSPIPMDFSPVLTTVVASASASPGTPLVDRITVGLAEGSRPWRLRADGSPVVLVADGVLYGPFSMPPAQSDDVPDSAPIAGVETVTIDGPGEYSSAGTITASAPGFYTWVWTIDSARQDSVGAASLPAEYRFASPFGLPEETLTISIPPRRLAATGNAPGDVSAVAVALLGFGVFLSVGSGISRRAERWH